MNIRRSLDHDGLDGILPSTKKQSSVHNHSKLISLIVIFLAIALFVFWPAKKINHDSQKTNNAGIGQTEKLSKQNKENKSLKPSPTQTDNENLKLTAAAGLEKHISSTESSAIQFKGKTENTFAQTLPIKSTDLMLKEPDKSALQTKLAANKQQSETVQGSPETPVVKNETKPQVLSAIPVDQITFLFEFSSSALQPLTNAEKERLTHFVDRCHNQISIVGHTCNKGSSALNHQLGLARANAMYQYLIEQGINASSITARSEGMEKPHASNATRSGRILNRRVELHCIRDRIPSLEGG